MLRILLLLPFLFLLYLIDLYVFQGVKTILAGVGPQADELIRAVFWTFAIGANLLLFIGCIKLLRRGMNSFSKHIFNGYLALFVPKLTYIAILFAEDIYRTVAGGIRCIGNATLAEASFFPFRHPLIDGAGMLVSTAVFVAFVHGITKGKHAYKVHKQTLYFDDLPETFDGLTITQISDVHAGSFTDKAAVQKGIDLIKAQGSDLFVFTGDIVNNTADELTPWMDHFRQIKAPLGQFSVLGNHDYGDYVAWPSKEAKRKNLEDLKNAHAALGYRLLLDEHVKLEKDGEHIYLLGVENWGIGFGTRGNLDKALTNVEKDAFKVLLSHDPTHWEAQVRSHGTPVHLTLSGHTHGMQFGIELPWFRWSPVKYRYRNWAGLYEHQGRRLYINRGFGFLGFSGRIGIWPEVTVLELRKSK